MKDKGICARTSQTARKVRAILIRREGNEGVILRHIRECLLYSKLRSLLLPQHDEAQGTSEHGARRGSDQFINTKPHEIPEKDSNEEGDLDTLQSGDETQSMSTETDERGDDSDDDNDGGGSISDDDRHGDEAEERRRAFVPSIKMKRMDAAILLISTVVLKDVSLTSALFRVLEEEKLDIVYENQYRTETKVSHTIQVKLSPEFDVDALKEKLFAWAGKPSSQRAAAAAISPSGACSNRHHMLRIIPHRK